MTEKDYDRFEVYNFIQPVGIWRRRGASDLFIKLAIGGVDFKITKKKYTDKAGYNIWHYWSEGPNPESTWELMRKKVKDDIDNSCSNNGEHPLHRLILKNKKQAADLWTNTALWPKDAKINDYDNFWHCLAWCGDISLFNTLKDRLCADSINETDEFGLTPLMIASHRGGEDMVREFMFLGADPDIQDNQGKTILHHVAMYGDISWYTKVQDMGARDDIKTYKGQKSEELIADKIKNFSLSDIDVLRTYWNNKHFQKTLF